MILKRFPIPNDNAERLDEAKQLIRQAMDRVSQVGDSVGDDQDVENLFYALGAWIEDLEDLEVKFKPKK